MSRNALLVAICFAISIPLGQARSTGALKGTSFFSKADRPWIWGWAWGAESTVSVVDRYPTLSFPSRPAAFGADLTDPLLGYVIPLSSFTRPCKDNASDVGPVPNLGCPKLCVVGPHEPDPAESWIALVQRGECQFVDKVRESQRLGAKAVVVGGDDPDVSGNPDTLVNMYSPDDSSDVTIASTFIKYSDYMELSALIATSNTSHAGLRTLSLLITEESSAWEWYSPIITFIIILVLPSILTFMTLLVHRVRAARAARRERAPEDVVQSLPWRIYTGNGWEKHEGAYPPPSSAGADISNVDLEQGLQESTNVTSPTPTEAAASTSQVLASVPWFETQQECAICLSEFVKGDRVRELPCQHIFHMDEVDEWLIHRRKVCPVCKADVTQPHTKPPSDGTPVPADSTPQTIASPPRSPSLPPEPTERTPLLQNNGA